MTWQGTDIIGDMPQGHSAPRSHLDRASKGQLTGCHIGYIYVKLTRSTALQKCPKSTLYFLYTVTEKENLPSDTDNKSKLGFSRDIEVCMLSRHAFHSDLIFFLLAVFFHIFLSSLKDFLAFFSAHLWFNNIMENDYNQFNDNGTQKF